MGRIRPGIRLVTAIAVIGLCGLLAWYGVTLISPGLAYDSESVNGSGQFVAATVYEPTLWGLAPIGFGILIAFATLLRSWTIAWFAMLLLTGFSFLTGFSIGGPMFLIAMVLWPLVMASALLDPRRSSVAGAPPAPATAPLQ